MIPPQGQKPEKLVWEGTVSSVTNTTTFVCPELSGKGDDYFKDWYVYAVWDADGAAAAPQGERVKITDYTSSSGTFDHVAFTASLAASDKIQVVHPILVEAVEALTATTGSGTLNDANTSDTIVPTTRPCKTELVLDISALNNASDDFTLDVKVGASGSEQVVAWFNLTSDGTDITCDTGSGVGFVIEQRRLNITDITVLANEQMIITRTKNGSTDRNVPYAYANRA